MSNTIQVPVQELKELDIPYEGLVESYHVVNHEWYEERVGIIEWEGKIYSFTYWEDQQGDIDPFGERRYVTFTEVEKRERIITEWVPVP